MDDLPVLTADCSQCVGLCCVILPFRAEDGFAIDKPGGTPCAHLQADDRCGIHDRLTSSGWPGCARYDCLGAGQQVAQVTYGGRSWRDSGDVGEMAAVFSVMRLLHRRLTELDPASPEFAEVRELTRRTPEELLALDLDDILG